MAASNDASVIVEREPSVRGPSIVAVPSRVTGPKSALRTWSSVGEVARPSGDACPTLPKGPATHGRLSVTWEPGAYGGGTSSKVPLQ